LVVAIVIDQLGSWVLEQHAGRLDRQGFFRTALREGRYLSKVRFSHAATYTAPGHATLLTGVAPSEHGILANERWHAEHGEIPWVQDDAYPVLGVRARSASPRMLRADTVGDALRDATGGSARVLSVSLKDRAAVLMGGHRANLALWYDPALPGFTTSSYYAAQMPKCVRTTETRAPTSSLLRPWTIADRSVLGGLGPDSAPGEGAWLGLTQHFPHEVARSEKPFSALRAMPQLSEQMLALAASCARELELGRDAVPDLLTVSISGTDYVGHVWGPESWEMVDMLRRVDAALLRFVDQLGGPSRVRLLVTADHGVTPLPESRGRQNARLIASELLLGLQQHAREQLGEGDFVQAFVAPYVVFGKEGRLRSRDTHRVVADYLDAHPAVFGSYAVRDREFFARSRDVVHRAVAQSMRDDAPGDVLVVPNPGALFDPDMAVGAGTSHGTPWDEDAEVPVILWGQGIEPGFSSERVDARRVASILRQWLGLPVRGFKAL
jgi:hypothetical protein